MPPKDKTLEAFGVNHDISDILKTEILFLTSNLLIYIWQLLQIQKKFLIKKCSINIIGTKNSTGVILEHRILSVHFSLWWSGYRSYKTYAAIRHR